MTFHIITIFPEIFNSYFNEGIISRAQKAGIIKVKTHDLRQWTSDKHKTVDDRPFGGGAGMVMKVEPIFKALKTIKQKNNKAKKQKIILLSAKGKRWNQELAKKYSKLDNIILICGRYEGIDERVKKFVDEEISIGDYVLTGGEIPAMAIVDSITRLLPGVLGNAQSAEFESHSVKGELEYPQYTRPEIFHHITHNMEHITKIPPQKGGRGVKKSPIENLAYRQAGRQSKIPALRVPKILLSGNHKKIEEWRKKKIKKVKNS